MNHSLLDFNHCFNDLYTLEGMTKIHNSFENFLYERNPEIHNDYRSKNKEKLISLAILLEDFLTQLFKINHEKQFFAINDDFETIYICKKNFIQRRVLQKYSKEDPNFDIQDTFNKLSSAMKTEFKGSEEQFAKHTLHWLKENSPYIEIAELYACWALFSREGKERHKNGTLFKVPQKIDFENLVGEEIVFNYREGFSTKGRLTSAAWAYDQSHYCIGCHKQKKDSCRTGFPGKKNQLGVSLTGCPLNQKISEMNILYSQNKYIAALAIITIDNPMVAATGHGICNACTLSCIFQKQTPVDIPHVETHILDKILSLPLGFEIYSLLTRWNPLKFEQPLPSSPTGKKILIVGMGPSGFGLAHELLNDGHTVVGIDGLNIDLLPNELKELKPILNIKRFFKKMDQRKFKGFGGVAEYGITARWNKNFLLVIRLLLERRKNFLLFSNVTLEGTITIEQCYNLGFDHVALCVGAGKPNLPSEFSAFPIGVYQASDFLMNLHLSRKNKNELFSDFLIRLPVGILGGGLTAVDAAYEALAYYPKQVIGFKKKYDKAIALYGEKFIKTLLNEEELEITKEFLKHAYHIEKECKKGKKKDHEINILKLLLAWGGATVFYRKKLQESPAYKINSLEIRNAKEQGVKFLDRKEVIKVLCNSNRLEGLSFKDGSKISLKTLLLATGTNPNVSIMETDQPFIKLKSNSIEFLDNDSIFIGKLDKERFISALGDLNPNFSGSVVLALASAKKGKTIISGSLEKHPPKRDIKPEVFFNELKFLFNSYLISKSIEEDYIKLRVFSPISSQNLKLGQFFRLTSNKNDSYFSNPYNIPLIGISEGDNIISFFCKTNGKTSKIVKKINPGDSLSLMGPIGSSLEVEKNQKILLLSDSSSHHSIICCMKKSIEQKNCKVFINQKISTFYDKIFVLGESSFIEKTMKDAEEKKVLAKVYGVIPSPMQCMMKGICGRCLQREKLNGNYVFACQNHIKKISEIDLEGLKNKIYQYNRFQNSLIHL